MYDINSTIIIECDHSDSICVDGIYRMRNTAIEKLTKRKRCVITRQRLFFLSIFRSIMIILSFTWIRNLIIIFFTKYVPIKCVQSHTVPKVIDLLRIIIVSIRVSFLYHRNIFEINAGHTLNACCAIIWSVGKLFDLLRWPVSLRETPEVNLKTCFWFSFFFACYSKFTKKKSIFTRPYREYGQWISTCLEHTWATTWSCKK